MNKAFVREPDADARVLCPKCRTPGTLVGTGPLDTHIRPEIRPRMSESAWCCGNADCGVVYFSVFEETVTVEELKCEVYPYSLNAPICACFGLTYDEIDQDSLESEPVRIRALLARSRSAEAQCQRLAVDGQCCIREVQRLYLKLKGTG